VANNNPLKIDIVADIVCPWCVVGFFQLKTALTEANVSANISWQPFELNPAMEEDGELLTSHLQKKYNLTSDQVAESQSKLVELGESFGFKFQFNEDSRIVNTFRAHQLMHWAAICDRQFELCITLYNCYFSRGRDISDVEVLTNAAVEAGLDFEEAATILEDQRYANAVREAQRVAITGGIQGVPAVIFNQRDLVVGAQGVEGYKLNILGLESTV